MNIRAAAIRIVWKENAKKMTILRQSNEQQISSHVFFCVFNSKMENSLNVEQRNISMYQ